MNRTSAVVVVSMAFHLCQFAYGQNSGVGFSSVGGGGGRSTGGSSVVISSVGHAAVGRQTAPTVKVESGFLSLLNNTTEVHLYPMQAKWNLISVPLIVPDYSKNSIYPTSVSNAFYFNAGYFSGPTLANGVGYWLKFDSAEVVPIRGNPRTTDTVDVVLGWNMIGSLSEPIPVGNVGSIPGGIITSDFFEFTTMYIDAFTLEPGKGYWVKVTQAGQLVLSSTIIMPEASRIRIVRDGELPPAPAPEK